MLRPQLFDVLVTEHNSVAADQRSSVKDIVCPELSVAVMYRPMPYRAAWLMPYRAAWITHYRAAWLEPYRAAWPTHYRAAWIEPYRAAWPTHYRAAWLEPYRAARTPPAIVKGRLRIKCEQDDNYILSTPRYEALLQYHRLASRCTSPAAGSSRTPLHQCCSSIGMHATAPVL